MPTKGTMNVRFKKTDKGEVAILPGKEYEALAAKADEDIGSAQLVACTRKEIAAGAPIIPKKIVDRIANGDNPLRVLREWRDMTRLELSFKADIGQGYISDLESGRRKGTTAALKSSASALKVPLDLLVWKRVVLVEFRLSSGTRWWYLVEIRMPCNTYLDVIRYAHDQELQRQICRADPSGPHGPEGFPGKSRQGSSPKTDYARRRRLSCGLELASRQPP
jgi:transcriptional regulator with XRE-family HTH domain